MKNFIITNLPTILIIAVFLFVTVYLVINKKWEELRGMAYRFILQAERAYIGTKRGKDRFEHVFRLIYDLIPPWLRFFFPEDTVREQIQEWFNNIKDYLDDGKMNSSTA